ncbi:MAG: EAL domain-containing protein [Leptolyngbya sp. RL_3_1]|nr:EAL domain-containing protein [Leptolyngbya sp. RL_3_1]
MARKDIYLVYQPIVCTQTPTVVGFEALARWEHPVYGAISPTMFIPLAEESGLIHEMGKHLIEAACFQLRRWQRRLTGHQGLTISVNLSASQLSQLDLADHIGRVLAATQIAPEHLKLEITESTLVENSEVVGIVLKKLRNLGVQLYLDDFGTGYSSLSRLPSLPLDALKIDRSFVTNKNWEICEVILALSQKLGLNVIVEGIETAEEARILEEIGFQFMQGYFFSHPLSVEAASAILSEPNPFRTLTQMLIAQP